MATPITQTISNVTVPAGDNFLPVGGATIPDGYTNLEVRLDVSNWLSTDTISVFASYSTDDGTTWADEGGITTTGGVHHDPHGNVALPGFNVDVPAGTGVKVRAHFIVPSSQRTSGTLTLT